MFITFVVVVVCDHFVSGALETHALVAPTASHSVTPICPHNGHFAALIGTHSHVVLLHVLFEQCVSSRLGFFTRESLVVVLFALGTIGGCTQVTFETVEFEHVNLFATCSVTESHDMGIFIDKLSYSKIYELGPRAGLYQALQIINCQFNHAVGTLDWEHGDIS